VFIKSVELSHFKSFGGTTAVPLRNGFTVISGPNGSGKSNILDALLFALGLSSSKGMRADRLPDLVNQSYSTRSRSTLEASVTVTFDISDLPRRLIAGEDENNPEDEEGDRPSDDRSTDDSSPGHADESPAESVAESNGHVPKADADDASADLNGHGRSEDTSSDSPLEWMVTRKLRVTPQGTYTSTYFINGEACTLTQLHEQLQRFRVYPEGYNVVLQGDVTGIISMNPRERREIIDELAGVAAFDRKIVQAKDKLESVREKEERFRIVERELTDQRDRLAKDRVKAEKYQRLRQQFQEKSQWELVLDWRSQQRLVQRIEHQIQAADQRAVEIAQQMETVRGQIQTAQEELDRLNARVKALGEDEQLALQSALATQEAEFRQLQRQEHGLNTTYREATEQYDRLSKELENQRQQLDGLAAEKTSQTQQFAQCEQERDRARQDLDQCRQDASAIAAASDAWIQEQTALRHQIDGLLQSIEPQRTEQARVQERANQLEQKIHTQTSTLESIARDLAQQEGAHTDATTECQQKVDQVQAIAQSLSQTEQELKIQQETQSRLLNEQRQKQRELDKIEAQNQALQESQGTYATKLLLQTGLPGVCGLVAQLGRVDTQYQRALEIAAGGRLGHLVVEDDGVAAAGIQLLKQQKAGRATFLPLNKIRPSRSNSAPTWKRPAGFIDLAVNLIDCENKYRDIFSYVFGNTAVFDTLANARQCMGQYRIVTLDGELLETSGAMTGGSLSGRQGTLHFGTVESGESAEAIALRQRLAEIDQVLSRCEAAIAQAQVDTQHYAADLDAARQEQRDAQLTLDRLTQQITLLQSQQDKGTEQRQQDQAELAEAHTRLESLNASLPTLEAELQRQRQALADLESSQTHAEWKQMQARIQQQEGVLNEKQLALRSVEQRLNDLQNQQQRLHEQSQQTEQQMQNCQANQRQYLAQQATLNEQQTDLAEKIEGIRIQIGELEQTLVLEKKGRDRAEHLLREHQTELQQLEWQLNKLREDQDAARVELLAQQTVLAEKATELPDPLPDIPEDLTLEKLQAELRSLQKRMQALEPVNMLALEEYNRTQERLEELSEKLTTLQEERTELLLRIENFTTLRQRAFREAFDAVNENFQSIFAELSDGDGYLQLDNKEDPFSSGLNLIAHPKGKPVRRLASMSGGEKSLTALSFIFALQRYRPSPFYAFDEVDMFLDGANVERLSKMIKKQAQQAQFIVVSLRRPMIEASERTIGVTQARGAYTQVLGIELPPQAASV
jgi:chromosome segregation protein